MTSPSPPTPSMTTLLVRNLEDSIDFYTTTMGLEVTKRGEGFIEFQNGGMRLALYPYDKLAGYLGFASETRDQRAGASRPMVVSFSVDSPEQLLSLHKRFTECGIPVIKEPVDTPWGQRAGFYLDPDGNLIELHTPLAESERGESHQNQNERKSSA